MVNKKMIVLLVVAVITLLSVVPVLAYFGIIDLQNLGINLFNKEKKVDNPFELDGNVTEGGLDRKSLEDIQEELNKKVADSMINISMNMNPVFADGKSEGNLMIVNELVNNYPQIIEIYTQDSNELIYKSGVIPVGSKIENAKLSKELPKGVYDCVAYFNSVDVEKQAYLGKAGAEIKIVITN